MQKRELHKLGKTELLSIIYEQEKHIEKLNDEIDQLNKKLDDKTVMIKEAGSIADATLKLNHIFEVAQQAADDYLKSIKAVNSSQSQVVNKKLNDYEGLEDQKEDVEEKNQILVLDKYLINKKKSFGKRVLGLVSRFNQSVYRLFTKVKDFLVRKFKSQKLKIRIVKLWKRFSEGTKTFISRVWNGLKKVGNALSKFNVDAGEAVSKFFEDCWLEVKKFFVNLGSRLWKVVISFGHRCVVCVRALVSKVRFRIEVLKEKRINKKVLLLDSGSEVNEGELETVEFTSLEDVKAKVKEEKNRLKQIRKDEKIRAREERKELKLKAKNMSEVERAREKAKVIAERIRVREEKRFEENRKNYEKSKKLERKAKIDQEIKDNKEKSKKENRLDEVRVRNWFDKFRNSIISFWNGFKKFWVEFGKNFKIYWIGFVEGFVKGWKEVKAFLPKIKDFPRFFAGWIKKKCQSLTKKFKNRLFNYKNRDIMTLEKMNKIISSKDNKNTQKKKNKPKKEKFDASNYEINMKRLEVEIAKRRKNESRFRFTKRLGIFAIVIVAMAIIAATRIFNVLQVSGNSMEPNLYSGNLLITSKFFGYEKGDMIAFYYNDTVLIKRIVATEGEVVYMDTSGQLFVNNKLVDEPYVEELSYGNTNITYPYVVPAGKVFILGDNRAISADSRDKAIGCISQDKIIGKIKVKLNPFVIY